MTVIECAQKVRSVCPYGETCGGGEYKEGSDCDKFAESLQNKKAHKPGVGLITREQVEKVWRSEWNDINPTVLNPGVSWVCRCAKCGCPQDYKHNFCPNCGDAKTDKAVDMVMERLEALKDGSTTD